MELEASKEAKLTLDVWFSQILIYFMYSEEMASYVHFEFDDEKPERKLKLDLHLTLLTVF